MCNGVPSCRILGSDSSTNSSIYLINSTIEQSQDISHNEGTSMESWTSPSIGTGDSKIMRDCAAKGYTVGVHPDDLSRDPDLIDKDCCHVLAYDIECEYFGDASSHIESPIICVCLKCTCGYMATVSRVPVQRLPYPCIVATTNSAIAEETMRLIIEHEPSFTIGHNVYEFDNVRLACSLSSSSAYRSYFQPTSTVIGSSVTSVGFIMTIPGVNNLDTLRYTRKAMPQRFSSFALGKLAQDLELSSSKLSTANMEFSVKWYLSCSANAVDMIRYNMMDCEVTIGVCFKLDLINQIIAICAITKAYIIDVMLYSTGAIAASALCSRALENNMKYIWTRCDYQPPDFQGGHVHFKTPIVCSYPMIIDFVSMYPSIVTSALISPECIDYTDIDNSEVGYHSIWTTILSYDIAPDYVAIAMTTYGLSPCSNNGCMKVNLIGKYCDYESISTTGITNIALVNQYRDMCIDIVARWQRNDHELPSTQLYFVDYHTRTCFKSTGDLIYSHVTTELMFSQCNELKQQCVSRKLCYNNIWLPNTYSFSNYAVDWESSPLGTECILSMPHTVCKHVLGTNLSSKVCADLMSRRKVVKRELKLLKAQAALQPNATSIQSQCKIKDLLQWALKITANSLYGALAFREYNTYSPRCGESVTMIGRWCLHVALAVTQGLGGVVVYGDTDSVMFVIPDITVEYSQFESFSSSEPMFHIREGSSRELSSNLIPCYVSSISDRYNMSRKEVLEYVSGSSCFDDLLSTTDRNIQGCICRIINHVMSFTPFYNLLIESQETGTLTSDQLDTFVFHKMMVLASKHYVAKDRSGKLYSKGVSYVRRTGAEVQNIAMKEFSDVVLSTNNTSAAIHGLRRSYSIIFNKLVSRRYPELFNVRTTRGGVTRNVVMLTTESARSKAIRHAELSEEDAVEPINVDYYVKSVRSCLRSVCKCIGLPDEEMIVNYH